MIGAILIVNLDRQPRRWRRVLRELGRFRTSDGAPLTSIARRFAAVDARDGRAVAATADVEPTYRIGKPTICPAGCEAGGVLRRRRTDQNDPPGGRGREVACRGLEGRCDRIGRFRVSARRRRLVQSRRRRRDRPWLACRPPTLRSEGGPRFLYLSYADAGGTAVRVDVCDALFRPVRGLWFLSGYVLSREGAAALLRAMPVIGPVDRGSTIASRNSARLRSPRRRSCRGRTAPPITPILSCLTWHGRGSSMRALLLCRPIGRAPARY